MTDNNLENAVTEKIEISLSMSHKNGSSWAVEEISKAGRKGMDYSEAELEQQLPAIQQFVHLQEPAVVGHYNKLKKLVDEHNKLYEEKVKNEKQI